MKNLMDYMEWLPFLQLALVFATFIATYSIAVGLKHVYPFWPYISDTGTLPPESSIFSLMLNFSSMILAVIMYIRHLQVSEFTITRPYIPITRWWNIGCTIIGLIALLGLAMVANFQELNAFVVHITGAFVCFVFSIIYFIIQCIFTYKMKFASTLIFFLRVILTCMTIASFAATFIPIAAAAEKFRGKNFLMWKPSDGGYEFHLISTISEWVLVLSFCLYISTFYSEFKRFRIFSHRVKFYEPVDEDTNSNVQERVTTVPSNWL